MCSIKTWSTKEDVIKDLVKTSGARIARKGKLNRSYFVFGDAPPPIISETDDEEMRLRFGDNVDTRRDTLCDNAAPDLQGIKNLLRMVEGSDEEVDTENTTPIGQRSHAHGTFTIAISKASKLNPEVKEFIPKGAFSSNSSSDISASSPEIKTNKNKRDSKKYIKDAGTPNYVTEDTPIDEDIAIKLKNEITSKSDSFEKKKQNNVAIASLLRMYAAGNNKKEFTKRKENVKLITPEYYEVPNRPACEPELENGTPPTTSSTPDPKSVVSIDPSCSSNDVRSEPAIPTQDLIKSPNAPKLDPAVKKSIEKVNNWFGEPAERKSPAVCLGPIAFKRKEHAASKSPSNSNIEQKQVSKPTQPNQYKPSNYAADLGKKYMERSKAKEDKQKKNAWANLEEILKEKDKILTKKQLEEARQNNNGLDAMQQ